jgi:Eisosome component PIL1
MDLSYDAGRLLLCSCAVAYKTSSPAACASPLSFAMYLQQFTMSLYSMYHFFLLMCFELGHTIRRQTAGQFGPDLAKKLSQLVKMEKNVMRSMELVGRERMEVAVRYEFWRITTID